MGLGSIQLSGRAFRLTLIMLLLPWSLQGCASTEQARENSVAAQATLEQQDDAQCKTNGVAPGSPAYQECRGRLVEKRAEEEAVQEKRREAFQRTTGEGTSALSGH